MSYLPDFLLEKACLEHELVSPFDNSRINPASIDLTLGRHFWNISEQIMDFKIGNFKGTAEPGLAFIADSVSLVPGVALLATTAEQISIPDSAISLDDGFMHYMLPALVADVKLKSSAARAGLDHALAGWVDPGFKGTLTLEFHAHRSIELIAGKPYVQLCVDSMLAAPRRGYQQTGRYVGQDAQGAVLSKGVDK